MKINKKAAAKDAAPKDEKKTSAASKEAPKKAGGNLPPKEEYAFDVATLAKDLGIKPASVRVALRNKDVPKAGKSYGWNDEKAYQKVLAQLKSAPKADKEEPAPKAKSKK